MSKGTILFADNSADFLDTRSEFLDKAGYRVLKAYTLEEAQQRLAGDYVHLAILDIRMVDDDDEKDTSGLTLAKDPAHRAVPKIILTNFPSYQAVREALGPTLDGLPPAVDFLDKREGPKAMIEAVEQALDRYVRGNRDLEIYWDAHRRLSFLYLSGLLQPGLPSEILLQHADELEDLFRCLFHDYRQIRIPQLFSHRDRRICLPVLARSGQGVTDARVVICGERGALAQEIEQIQKLTPETLHGTRLDGSAETLHFGAAAYALPDTDLETVRPMRALFQDGKKQPLKTAFNHLLREILPAWHQHGQVTKDQGLMALYRQHAGLEGDDLSQMERQIDALVEVTRHLSAVEVQRSRESVVFRFPHEPPLICPDPLTTAYSSLEQYSTATLCRLSPGRLTAEGILVDDSHRTWLTDFAQAGQVPQWWDFVCLEAMIRFDLSPAPDLLAWLELEEYLTQPAHLHDRLPARDVIPSLKTSVALIEQVRRQAGSETGSDPLPYEAGLLIWVVGAMAGYKAGGLYTREERMRGAHLLLAAGLLAQRITHPPSLSNDSPGLLCLDRDGVQVRRGKQRIPNLGSQELELFRCLYAHAGQVVSRQLLVERVFGKEYLPSDPENSLNTLVRRLRVKVEPDPDVPRYILTVKGVGYRLQVEGKADE